MKLTLNLVMRTASDNESVSRSMGNINKDYISYASQAPGAIALLPYKSNGEQYENFMDWADDVARGLMSLSNNTYSDAKVVAEWSAVEELTN